MATTRPKFYWHPSIKNQTVEFAAQSTCSYLELLLCPGPSAATSVEGMLDDAHWQDGLKNSYIS